MKCCSYKFLFLLIGLISGVHTFASTYDYGLFFHSNQVPGKKRTSLLLGQNKTYTLRDEFTVDFQLLLRDNEPGFGSVLHLTTNENQVIRFVLELDDKGDVYPTLVFNDGISRFNAKLRKEIWMPVTLHLNAPKNQLKLSCAGRDTTFVVPLRGTTGLKVQFGRIDNYVSDVAPMNVRDIHLFQDNAETRYWKLEKHQGELCYDEYKKEAACANFASWLIDNHVEWKRIYTCIVPNRLDLAFNARDARFYLVRENEVEVLDDNAMLVEKHPVKGGCPITENPGHCIYDTLSNRLISYSLSTGKVSRFSFDTERWSEPKNLNSDVLHFNHARTFNAADSSYYFFGGYGHYKYHSDLYRLKYNGDEVQKVAYQNPVDCRFGAAMCVADGKLYVMGGRGNKFGKQALESYYYYDLWQIDLKTQKAELLWRKKDITELPGLILASSMYYNPDDNSFYAVNMDDGGGKLMKYSKRDTSWMAVSRPIKNDKEYQNFDYSLYYSAAHQKFFLLVDKMMNDNSHNVSIYSLNTPLLDEVDILQSVSDEKSVPWYLYVAIGICGCVLAAGGCFLIRAKRRKMVSRLAAVVEECDPKALQTSNAGEKQAPTFPLEETHYFDRSRSSISLLGSFNVRDKEGNDITTSFTPRLKELLILLILYTEKAPNGILTKKISDLLWEDKEEDSARNNRNVTVRKLRVLLKSIGDVEISSNNGFMSIVNWGENVFCDYHAILGYVKEFKQNKECDNRELLYRILEILLYGPLLSNTQSPWLDEFKDAYSSLSIDLLRNLLELEGERQHPEILLRIADIMFLHDPLNEEALVTKCKILTDQGKRGIAKGVYDRFCKEYKDSLAEEYKVSFSDLYHLKSPTL